MSSAKSYTLSSIADLLDVPAERREDCIREVLTLLVLQESVFGGGAKEAIMLPIIWVDDGVCTASLRVKDAEGNTVLDLERVTEGGA